MEENLLDIAAERVYKELEKVGGDPMKLPNLLRPVAILYTVQAMVDNGGFQYLFESNFPFCPPYSVFSEAYRQIGAHDAADRLDKAVALFPIENPESDQEGRNKFMDSLSESDDFFLLGNEVCGDQRVWELMEMYVKNHSEAFA
jgi:Domain of unknown function (DUF4375)